MIFDVVIWNSYDELMNGDQYTNGVRFEGLGEHEVAAMLAMLHRSHLTAVIVPRTVEMNEGE